MSKSSPIKKQIESMMETLGCKNIEEFATKIGTSKANVSKWVTRGTIPDKWITKYRQLEKEKMERDQRPFEVEVLSIRPGAGKGTELEAVDLFNTGEKIFIDRSLLKTPPKGKLRAMQVDGYSMVPMLFPDSWVIVDESKEYVGDGLYVINVDNVLMVKLVEKNLSTGNLWIKSINPDYDSWEVTSDDQRVFEIFGRVIRCII